MFWSFVQLYRPNQFQTLEFADFMVLDKIIKKGKNWSFPFFDFWSFFERNEPRMFLMKLFFISGIVIVKVLENVGKIGPVEIGHKWLLQQITQCKKVRISNIIKNYFGWALGRIKSSKVCYVPFFPSISPNHAEKKMFNYGRFTNSIWHFADWI